MKRLLAALVALSLAFPAAYAQRGPDAPVAPLQQRTEQPDERELQSHDHYRAKDGHAVHSPAKSVQGQVPSGASAKCRDGTYSFSQHRRGTCSHHGGVDAWF